MKEINVNGVLLNMSKYVIVMEMNLNMMQSNIGGSVWIVEKSRLSRIVLRAKT